MSLHELDTSLFGYALSEGYSHGRSSAFRRTPSYDGPSVNRLIDDFPIYVMRVAFDWSDAQYNAFQTFFRTINFGQDRFKMLIVMTLEVPFSSIVFDTVPVRMMGMWQANFIAPNRWKINMDVEVPYGTNVLTSLCDVIFAGVPSVLPSDDIYAGTPDNLATDIIEPCQYVDPKELLP